MDKNVRNLIIVGIVALLLGYVAGGAMQTGRCPITGIVLLKDRAASCDKTKSSCEKSCDKDKKDANATETSTEAATTPEATPAGSSK